MKRVLCLLLLIACSFATIQLVTPKHITLRSSDTVEISPVGPGHDVFLKFQRKTENYVWDRVELINDVDPDFETSTYDDYQYIYYIIHVPRGKASGMYTFEFEIIDNEGLQDRERAVVQVGVTHDQDDLIFVGGTSERFDAMAGEEILVPLDVQNKALSRVHYQATASVKEMPSLGEDTSTHSFLSGEVKRIYVPVTLSEEGEYKVNIRVWSEDNPTIDQRTSTTILVKPTFQSKLKSIGKGFPLVPLTMAPFYAVLGIFSW